jgi:putative ABC transport system permease protein
MNVWIALALKSAWSRRGPLTLVVSAIGVAVFLVLAVAQIRQDARASFSNAVSGVDIIVGARGSSTELMLYSVFHLGKPVRNMSFGQLDEINKFASVAWAVPLQLGDSYRGYPVIGTTPQYFSKTGGKSGLEFLDGQAFSHVFDAVLGADVAKRLGHNVGDNIALTHGKGDRLAQDHSDRPFRITGILRKTGTPADTAVFISLAGFQAIHIGWEFGSKPRQTEAFDLNKLDPALLQPSQITAVLVGLQSRTQIFSAKRSIEGLDNGKLMVILPGVTLDELWQVIGTLEDTFRFIGWLVVVSTLLGVAATLLIALSSRRKELAIFRALGLQPLQLSLLIVLESLLICAAGLILGWILLQVTVIGAGDWIRNQFGVIMLPRLPDPEGWWALASLMGLSILISLIPAWRAFRYSLHDGLHPPTV